MSGKEPELPEGIEVPEQFAQSERLTEWFIAGVHDGIDAFGLPHEDGFTHHHEEGAWEAYKEGYEAGCRWHEGPRDELLNEE